MANNKRIKVMAAGAAFALFVLGTSSFAAVINAGDTITLSSTPGRISSFNGGAFRVHDQNTGFTFDTFCIELSETISLGSTLTNGTHYQVAGPIGLIAYGGGKGDSAPGTPLPPSPPGTGDHISSKTAYLYSSYVQHTIPGLSGTGTGLQQEALQYVFWYLENEIVSIPNGAWKSLADSYLALTNGIPEDGLYYGVVVINPTLNGRNKQSFLAYVPVPEANALWLFGTGLAGLIGSWPTVAYGGFPEPVTRNGP